MSHFLSILMPTSNAKLQQQIDSLEESSVINGSLNVSLQTRCQFEVVIIFSPTKYLCKHQLDQYQYVWKSCHYLPPPKKSSEAAFSREK
jgi:hypothetical protein